MLKLVNRNKGEVLILELLHECFEKIDEEELKVAPNDLYLLLRKQNSKISISANEIRNILKRWNSHGEFVKVDRRGRFYNIKKFLFYKLFDALMQNEDKAL